MIVKLLDYVTTVLLFAVLLLLGWLLLAAFAPASAHWAATEVEVSVSVGLLAGTLVLVSVTALLHTRS
jgi:hypothetical protein